jgi:hypothetical protein
MKRYEPSTPGAVALVAAVAMTTVPIALALVVPAMMAGEFASPDATTSSTATSVEPAAANSGAA